MLIYGYIPKSKQKKLSKLQQQRKEEWLSSINSLSSKRIISKSKNKSLTGYLKDVPVGRESPKIASLDTGFITCVKKFGNSYTGDKIKGIGTMHKSNAVPVFSDNEAKDLSSMRR
jgi:hypothetical protein